MNTHTDSPIRFCKTHEEYYVAGNDDGLHASCTETFALQWGEVTYYLHKLRSIKDLFGKLRTELAI